jgi:hypothetical protein
VSFAATLFVALGSVVRASIGTSGLTGPRAAVSGLSVPADVLDIACRRTDGAADRATARAADGLRRLRQ